MKRGRRKGRGEEGMRRRYTLNRRRERRGKEEEMNRERTGRREEGKIG